MSKDYYLVLGITSKATPDDIKEAYRRLVKEYHPDHYGDNPLPFLAIQEAYSVLSDPAKRQTHDRKIGNQKRKIYRGDDRISRGPKARVEPLIPDQDAPMDLGTASLSRSFHSYRPSFDALFDRIFSNFRQADRSKSEHPENLNVVITLTPEQAFQGGRIRITVPAERVCPICRGRGRVGGYQCGHCMGKGRLSGEYPVRVGYPSGMPDRYMVQLPLHTCGIDNLYLTVHFRISDIF